MTYFKYKSTIDWIVNSVIDEIFVNVLPNFHSKSEEHASTPEWSKLFLLNEWPVLPGS